jgi:hypothetical protein
MKKFLKKVKEKIVTFFRRLTGATKEIIPVGIKIVEAIKRITDSDIADVFVELTVFTELDDKLLKLVRKVLPKILIELDEWDEILDGTTEEKLRNSLIKINSYPKLKKNLLYLGIATEINRKLSKNSLTYAEALRATHETYNDPTLLNA